MMDGLSNDDGWIDEPMMMDGWMDDPMMMDG